MMQLGMTVTPLRRWIVAEFFSSAGDQFLIVTLAFLAAQKGAAQAGFVLASGAAASAVAAVAAGAVVDHIGYRHAMLVADLGRGLSLILTAVIWRSYPPDALALSATAAIVGILGAFYEPGAIALGPTLAPTDSLSTLHASRSTSLRGGMLLGALAAGACISHLPAWAMLLVDGGTFGITALAVWSLPKMSEREDTQDRPTSFQMSSIAEGYRYIGRHRVLWASLGTLALLEFGATGAVNIGVPTLVTQRAWSASVIANGLAAFGLGALVGPLLSLAIRRTDGRRSAAAIVVISAIGVATLRVPTGAAWVLTVLFTTGLAASGAANVVVPAMQASCTPRFLGRMGSALSLTLEGVTPASMLVAGLVAQLAGLAHMFLVSALMCAISALLIVGITPRRNVQHFLRNTSCASE